MAKNFGRRMVDEEAILKIGQGGGGGTPIEAGTGISITGTDTKTIAVDDTIIATKTDLNSYVAKADATSIMKVFDYSDIDMTDCQVSTVDGHDYLDISNIMNSIPILMTVDCTDAATLENPIIDVTANSDDTSTKRFYFKGIGMIKDTANNKYFIVSTWNQFDLKFGQALDTTKRCLTKEFYESGSNSYFICQARPQKYNVMYYNTSYNTIEGYLINGTVVPFENITCIRLNPGEFADTNINKDGVKGLLSYISFDYSNKLQPSNSTLPNLGEAFRIPTTEGSYALTATVNSSGVATPAWAATSGATVYRHSITVTGFGTSQATDKLYFQLYTTSNTQITGVAGIGSLLPADGSIVPATGFQTDSQTSNTSLVVGVYLDQTDLVPAVKLLALDNGPAFTPVNNLMGQPSQTVTDVVDQI